MQENSGYLLHLGWVLVVFGFHGISLFHLNCKTYMCRFVHSIPWLSFYGGSIVIIFSFIPDTGIFVFFLCQSYKKGLSFYFFSQSVFCFTVFSYCFCFNFTDHLLFPSFCLLALGFGLVFLFVYKDGNLSYWFETFLPLTI